MVSVLFYHLANIQLSPDSTPDKPSWPIDGIQWLHTSSGWFLYAMYRLKQWRFLNLLLYICIHFLCRRSPPNLCLPVNDITELGLFCVCIFNIRIHEYSPLGWYSRKTRKNYPLSLWSTRINHSGLTASSPAKSVCKLLTSVGSFISVLFYTKLFDKRL